MARPLVSVIIPTHNRKNMVIRLLRSVLASTYSPLEIIVVDDASSDGTGSAIAHTFSGGHKIRVIRNTTNRFSAGSRNTGMRKARGVYLFFIDDDNVLDKYAIDEMVKVFEKDTSIGELGLQIHSFYDKNKILWLQTKRNMWTSKTYQAKNLKDFSQKTTWDTADVPNAFMVRATVMKKHHLSFCRKFEIMYEESDLAYRIRNAGYTIQVVRNAIIYHDNEELSPDGRRRDYLYHFMNDDRRFFVFARNRIIFHSLYSDRIGLLFILGIWIWVFMVYYLYKIVSYSGVGSFSVLKRIYLSWQYVRGVFDGLFFVIRREKLQYS